MARRNNQLNQREMKVIQSEVIHDSFNFDELFMLFLQDGNLRNLRPHTLTLLL
jgi:integrase/recombinase XerD